MRSTTIESDFLVGLSLEVRTSALVFDHGLLSEDSDTQDPEGRTIPTPVLILPWAH
jgi:hypothetical protein